VAELTPEVAAKLSTILGGSTEYWINRETQFRADAVTIPIDRRYRPDWLNTIPFAELVRLGWIENRSSDHERAAELLRFFGIDLSIQWRLRYAPGTVGRAFRTSASHIMRHEALTAWLRRG